MRKHHNYLFLLFLLFHSGPLFAQLKFDIKSFNEKFEVVQWLCVYDKIAWWTTDSVLAAPEEEKQKLGHEWFCYYKDQIWHAAYGKYEHENFCTVFHYTVDKNSQVHRDFSNIDSNIANPYARASIRARDLIKPIKDTINIQFNQYIKRNQDSTLSVWLFPAFSQASEAIYGGEFYYKFDRMGNSLLEKEEYFQGAFRGFKTGKPREIWLDYKNVVKPTLGSIFFVWYYKQYFTNIFIQNKKSKSTVSFDKTKGEYFWLHIDE